ncbi:MAG TPA: YlbF family regulator [Gemmatimonadales bacterium]
MILEKAKEIGRLIGQSDEYKALRRAEDRVKDMPEVRTPLDQLQQLQNELEDAAVKDGRPSDDQIARYNALVTAIQGFAVYQEVVAAQTNFDKLMLKVNQEILAGIKLGAASPIITLS